MPPERRSSPLIVWGGGAVAALLAGWLLFGRGEETPVATPPPAPAPVAPQPAAPAAPAPAATPAVSLEGLRLFGVAGAGAIIGTGDGSQRLVAIGREVRPGLVLAGVGVDHAILRSGEASYRLGFDGVTAAAAGGGAAAAPANDAVALRAETVRYRLGLAPVMENGRVAAYQVRPGADLPALARAGIRAGDVIRSVNGAQLDAERLEELAWTLANSGSVMFEIVRDGQPQRVALSR